MQEERSGPGSPSDATSPSDRAAATTPSDPPAATSRSEFTAPIPSGPPAAPPYILERLLHHILPSGVVADSIIGDLREEYAIKHATSRAAARRWYARESAGIAVRALADRLRGSGPYTTDVRRRRFSSGDNMISSMLRSLKHGARGLARAPQFTIAAALTLGLAIGSNAAIFSVVQGVLLKPLPFADPDRLVSVRHSAPGLGYDRFGMSAGLYHRYSEGADAFESWGFYTTSVVNVTGADSPPGRLQAAFVSRDMLPTMGVAPQRGRVFGEGEAEPDGAAVVILSHGLWQERFGGNDVLGQSLDVDGTPRTIVGVMPARFTFPDAETRLWLPLNTDPANAGVGDFSYLAVGRLRAGLDADAAQARLAPVVTRLREDLEAVSNNFAAFMERGQMTTLVTPLKQEVVGDVSNALWILLGTVAFVFLIACANVANLFLVRAETRQREMAVRAALGAGRVGLIGHYLAEAVLIAVAGGLLGIVLAWSAVRALVAMAPPSIPRLHEIGIDPSVLAFTFVVTLLGALLLGLLPAVRLSAPALLSTLGRASRGATAGRSRHHARHALVVAQTALALILLVGSGLMVRSFQKLRAVEPGFVAANTATFRVALPTTSYEDNASVAQFHGALLERLQSLPGVSAVGAVSHPPLVACCSGTAYLVEDHPTGPGEMPPMIGYSVVTQGWFEAMGMTIRAGRTFDGSDAAEQRYTVVISEAVARRFWPDGDAVGRRVRPSDVGSDTSWYSVVGVVGDLRARGLMEETYPMVYFPVNPTASELTAGDSRSLLYVLRTTRTDDVAAAARDELWAFDANLPVTITGSYEKILATSMVRISFTMFALVAAALIALVLGVVGLYSVVSYIVVQRTSEIGIRMALGAQPGEVRRMLLLQGGVVVLVGIVVGVGGALALTRLMQGVLYGTEPTDPLTYAAVSGLLAAVALMATYLPARRASRIHPASSLKEG